MVIETVGETVFELDEISEVELLDLEELELVELEETTELELVILAELELMLANELELVEFEEELDVVVVPVMFQGGTVSSNTPMFEPKITILFITEMPLLAPGTPVKK